jgi:putative membrane protein
MQACNNSASDDSVAKADSTNEARDTTNLMSQKDSTSGMGVNDDVADFAVKAANAGLMEVQLGEYASKNATDKSVKQFGSMMVKDHSKANDELKALATSKNISIPAAVGEDKTDDMNDLMKKTGKDFDKAYMNQMVKDHKDAIDLFQKASDDSKDADMKAFASKTLPALKKHLDEAEAIVKSHDY